VAARSGSLVGAGALSIGGDVPIADAVAEVEGCASVAAGLAPAAGPPGLAVIRALGRGSASGNAWPRSFCCSAMGAAAPEGRRASDRCALKAFEVFAAVALRFGSLSFDGLCFDSAVTLGAGTAVVSRPGSAPAGSLPVGDPGVGARRAGSGSRASLADADDDGDDEAASGAGARPVNIAHPPATATAMPAAAPRTRARVVHRRRLPMLANIACAAAFCGS
jgi:hypothetical protein